MVLSAKIQFGFFYWTYKLYVIKIILYGHILLETIYVARMLQSFCMKKISPGLNSNSLYGFSI